MRLLQAVHQHAFPDDSTGLANQAEQDEAARRYATANGHVIIATAVDTDDCCSFSPSNRPELGPWLMDPGKIAQYDAIFAANLDSIGRSARDLSKLRDWVEDNGKRVIVLSPWLQWPPSADDVTSPIIWDILGQIGENELYLITKRSHETPTWIQANGIAVGKPPFGYRSVPDGSNGMTIRRDGMTILPDPEAIRIVKDLIRHHQEGWSLIRLCGWLDSEGVHKHTLPPRPRNS